MIDPFDELFEELYEDFFEDAFEDPFEVPKKSIKGKSLGTVFLMLTTVFLMSGFLFATFTGSDSQLTSFFTEKNSGVTIAQQDITLQVGEKLALEAVLTDPSAGTKSLTWTSSNTSVATVDQTLGIVRGVSAGTSTITVETEDGEIATTEVTVEAGTGTIPEGAYEIWNEEDLQNMPATVYEDPNGYAVVMQDFACSGTSKPFTQIPTFEGTLDGQGYTISNFYSTTGGVFATTTSTATIKNVNIQGTVDNPKQADAAGTAILVDVSNGSTIENCNASGTVSTYYSTYGTGILVGVSDGSTIENCSSSGNVTGDGKTGGLIGHAMNGTEITNCSSSATVGNILYGTSFGVLVGYCENSTITDSYSTGICSGFDDVGGLVGYAINSTITNSYSTVNVDCTNTRAGGLVGKAEGSTIKSCYATGEIIASQSAGGLVGSIISSTSVSSCYATGHVTATTWYAGGLVGQSADSTIDNCFATGDLESQGPEQTRGLVASTDTDGLALITDSYAYENQTLNNLLLKDNPHLAGTGLTNNIATFEQLCDTSKQLTLLGTGFAYQADNYPHVLKADGTGEVPGQSWIQVSGTQTSIDPNIPSVTSATLENAEYGTHENPTVTVTLKNPQAYTIESIRVNGTDYSLNGSTTTDGVTTGTITIAPPSTAGSDVLVGTIEGLTYTNNGTQRYSAVTSVPINAELVYIAINDAQDLAAIQTHPQKGETGVEFRVMNDIDMSSISDFEPITDFNATFNGQGYTISNYNSTKNGIFATTGQGAVIKDTNVSGNIEAPELANGVGLLVGSATGTTIEGSSASGTINASGTSSEIGLLVGSATDTTIEDSSTSGTVTGANDVGGLVGLITNGSIADCYSTATVTSSHSDGERIGGLVGNSYNSSIEQSYATGDVTGWLEVGGLVGKSHGSTTTATYATGDITANQAAGGLVGSLVEGSELSYSYAIGSVDSNESDQGLELGGLIGNTYASSIQNCFATGDVSGVDQPTIHGLVGRNSSDSATTVTNSFAYEFQTVNGVFIVSNPDLAGSDDSNSFVTNAELSTASWQNDLLTNDFTYQDGNYPQLMDSDGNILQGQTWVPIPDQPVGYETLPADQEQEVNENEEETAEADSFKLFDNRINRMFNRIFTAFGLEEKEPLWSFDEKSIFASN